ncbi:MAG TPA: Npt1/Npt2 family nucleotide transporter [Terriglobia bacterium]|nr:Npt1/Npt2 family nucleotide transporter [Terriglobia bacterium]
MRLQPSFVERIFDVRRQEAERVVLMSAYLLLIITSYTTVKAVRDSLFVTNIGPSQLPYMYLLIAVAMGLVSYVYSRLVNRIGLYRLIRATSLFMISHLVIFWFVFRSESSIWFYVFYVWVSLFGAITASQCWLLSSHVFNPREARRVFAWIGAGGILGGILGGGLTSIAARRSGTESLILIGVIAMALTLALLERIKYFAPAEARIPRDEARKPTESEGGTATMWMEVRRSRHLFLMVMLLTIAVIVEAFIDYEYKFVAKHAFTSKDHLTSFFGTIAFYIGLFSLLFQMLLTGRILKRFGVGWAIMLLPSGLLAASVMLALKPTLWTAALLQLIDGGFSYSIHRAGTELLFLPIPPQTRNAVKGFIDMFVDRLGRAMGGVILLLLTAVLALSISSLSIVACGLLIAWIAAAFAVKRQYLHSFRRALKKKTIEPEALQVRTLDNATFRTLVHALSSEDERLVLYAMDLLSNTHPDRWRQHIQVLIQHPSGAVRARTIALLAEWNDPSITREEFIYHPDYQTARIAAASLLSLRWNGSRPARELLTELLNDSSPEVSRQAIRTAGSVGMDDAIPLLIQKLAEKRLRPEAREALLKFGDKVIPELVRRLFAQDEPAAVRIRIPKALAFTGNQRAADALMDSLHRFDYYLDFASMKALNRMRQNRPAIAINEDRVCEAINKEREDYARLRSILGWLQVNAPHDSPASLLTRAVRERLEERLERVFRLVALIYPPHDIYSVYYNCKAKPALRASAVEFLDNLLTAELRSAVVPLLEDSFDPETAAGAQERIEFISTDAVLETLIGGSDPWLKTIAMHLARRYGTFELTPMPGRNVG